MSNLKKLAGVLPFAHLLGIKAESDQQDDEQKKKEDEAKRADWAKKAETDDERKQKEGESDEDYASRMEEMDEEEEKKAKSKAEEGEEEAKADEQDGSDGEEAKAERSRCAKIMAHGIKHGNAAQAGVFAFNTRMSVNAAIAALTAGASMSPAKGPGLGQRMASVSVAKVGPDAPQAHDLSDPNAKAKAVADQIIASAAKVRGEKV